jgi:hypothetical protein
VPRLKRLIACLSPRRPGFALGAVHVVFVVDKVALSRLFSEFFRFPPVTQYSTIVLSPSIIEHEVCDSPDQAAHYNTLGQKLGASALTRHLDYPGVRYYYHYYYNKFRSRVSSGSIVSDYGLDDRAIGVRSPQGQRIFPLASVSRPALGPTQPPVRWVPGVLSPGQSAAGRDADHSPHLVPRSWMSRSYTSSPPSASMACSGTSLLFYYNKLCLHTLLPLL